MRGVAVVVALSLVCGFGFKAHAESPVRGAAPETARQLMKDVIYNELHDREKDSYWQYRSHVVTDKKNILREQIETSQGPLYRILARDGQELQGASEQKEVSRLVSYVHDPGAIAKVQRSHETDETRLAHVMELLPLAYVFQYEGPATGSRVRLRFEPDPKYKPSSYEDRIMYGLGGEIVVDQTLKRLVSMHGTIEHKIDFGFGLLGYVDPGGTFTIRRKQVSQRHWKTDLVDVHVQGRVLLFSSVSKVEREKRYDFQPVPHTITLQEAMTRLKQSAQAYQAQMESAATGATAPAEDALLRR
jgi:hypothetical protein